jgi:hypothetical protein
MIKRLMTTIEPKLLEKARQCARMEANGFLIFDGSSRCYQLLFGRDQFPAATSELEEEWRRLVAGGCCGAPAKD